MRKEIKNILIGISGGIAAYKIPYLIREFTKKGYSVRVVISKNGESLVGVDTLRTLTGSPVYRETASEFDMGHIRLDEWADIFILAPATANSIAKMANGIADNLLSTLFLSLNCPIIVAPAMNINMWNNLATKANIATLISRGITVLPVGYGDLACGVIDKGRMLEPKDIAQYIDLHSIKQDLSDKKVLIVSGPTVESIDPVRTLSNRSSGRMGAALARVALVKGAEVLVISGPATTPIPGGTTLIKVQSAHDMLKATISTFTDFDIIIMVAAVSDYTIDKFSESKISTKKGEGLTLYLNETDDIAQNIGKLKNDNQKLVTFALETSEDDKKAIIKMRKKNSDISIYNKVSESLGKDETSITIFTKSGKKITVENSTKEIAALKIFDTIDI